MGLTVQLTRPHPLSSTLLKRLMEKVEVAPSGCWLWTGPTNVAGYARTGLGGRGRSILAHRLVYEETVGAIPLPTIDHLCRTRRCVNPEHLEPVTQKENILRGIGFAPRNKAKTHCLNGHPLVNAYVSKRGQRWCRVCRAARKRAAKRRRDAS